MNYKVLSITAMSLSAIAVNNDLVAQRTCGYGDYIQFQQQQDPAFLQKKEDYERVLQHWISQHENQKTPAVITIPVVVHVLYKNAQENISDAQIQSQIDVLNEDFRRLNADASNTPSVFASVAADTEIEFCLAQRDPNGQATNGIVRKTTNVSSFQPNNQICYSASGGDDAWDVTRYYNMWVAEIASGILGFAEIPTASLSNSFGLVCSYENFGNIGNLRPNYDLGRTATHEVGHSFGLQHIWGHAYDISSCTDSDNINDTPNQNRANYNCPSHPFSSCSNGGDMFMNYMDYVDDDCMNMFSQGQKTRMLAVLNTPPWNVLQNSNGCMPLGAAPLDAGISAITSPTGSICASSFVPMVTLQNFGSTALTTVTIKYSIDGGAASSFSWTGNLAANATTSVNLPLVNSSIGAHTFAAYTENPNGTTDGNAANNQSTSTFSITSGGGSNLPLLEGFESSTFPPSGWAVNNPDNDLSWVRTTNASKTGVASAYMNNSNYPELDRLDELTSPNFTVGSSAMLTFDVAYSLWTDPNAPQNFSDTLIVYYSSTCGSTWTPVYKKFGSALTTKTPIFQGSPFTPLSSQWRNESVHLTPYFSGSAAGMIKFQNVSGYENNLYLDNITISSTTHAQSSRNLASDIIVYPNPGNGTVFVNGSSIYEIRLLDVLGNVVIHTNQTNNGTFELNIDKQASGVYFVNVRLQDQSVETIKIIKN